MQTWYWRAAPFSLHAVAHKVRDDICLKLLGRINVGRAFTRVALLEPGKSAPIERTRELRIGSRRRIIVGDGQVPLAQLQVNQPPRVEGGGDIRLQPQRLVAIRQRRLSFADYRATPAASVPRRLQRRI